MNKKTVERLIKRHLGININIPMTDKGNHIWESEIAMTSPTNSGLFAAFFERVSISVNTAPAIGYDGWYNFRLSVRWYHIGGGENGASTDLFYLEPKKELMTREQANARYWSKR